MALSKLEPAHYASSISSLPDHDFSLMAAIGNTPLVELKHLNPNPGVRLREVPARVMAVVRYSGVWAEEKYRKQEARLLAALKATKK